MSEDYDDLRVFELRREILRRLGYHQNERTAMTKPAWNSLHAWFEAEFATYPDLLYTDRAPTKPEIMDATIIASTDPCPNDFYTDALERFANYVDREGDRAANRDELIALLEAMDESGDRRPTP